MFLELCGKLLKIDVSAKEVSQRERELILCLLTAIVVKDVKTSDLNNYIEKMVKIQVNKVVSFGKIIKFCFQRSILNPYFPITFI